MAWGDAQGAAAPAAEHRIARPPSMVELAAVALRRMILSGDLLPGQRVVENRLTQQLGVSRPPLREAMRVLEREGLIRHEVPRGAIVTPLTMHDVYEIFTLRRNLERMAVDLGVPVREPARLRRCRTALAAMDDAAERGDRAAMSECAFEFHLSVIGLSGHQRLEETYRSLQLQMLLCMALNRQAREQQRETMHDDAARHRRLLERIEAGDPEAVHHELAHHGDATFLQRLDEVLEDGSEVARAWLDRIRAEGDVS
jgi:DNA-binding GntR family transcriptional regulator